MQQQYKAMKVSGIAITINDTATKDYGIGIKIDEIVIKGSDIVMKSME